jgi:hypothetical protein
MKPKLKPSESERLKLNCADLLSNFAFKSNLRHYRVVIPQSYDFHETPGVGCGVEIAVKNEDKPWVGLGGYCCCPSRCRAIMRIHALSDTHLEPLSLETNGIS